MISQPLPPPTQQQQQQQQQQQPQQHSRSSNSDDDSGCALEEYAWCPPGLKAEQVRQFFKCFPEDKVPFLNSIGEKYRARLLETQLPPQDSDPKYCRALTEDEKNELRTFNEQQRHNAFGRGVAKQLLLTQSPLPCRACQNLIDSGSICVYAERAGRTGFWHPQCFTCIQCKEFLVNLIYFHKDGFLYCGRHHAELYKPRCTACDEIIFSDECTEAEGYSWHMDHFSCSNCTKRLGGERYVMRQNQPFCLSCFETMYAEYCDTCGERIETDQAQMAHESQHWHATDACFYCYTCRIPLLNRAFFPRYGALFCSNECALKRNNRFNNKKFIQQQKFDKGPDIIPTTYKNTTQQHVKVVSGRPKSYYQQQQQQQPNIRAPSSRPKDQGGYTSDGAYINKYKRDYNNGYSSDGTGTRRFKNIHQQYQTNSTYVKDKPQVFLQLQSSPESILKNRQQEKMNSSKVRSREPIQFYNDLNLEQLDRHGATLEIARCSTSKSSRSSLPDLSNKTTRINSNKSNHSILSQETLIDSSSTSKTRLKNFDSNEIMYPISRPKSVAFSTVATQFPRSRSLNGSGRFTKQHHVRFVDDEKEKRIEPTSVKTNRSKKYHSSSSSSSSSSSESDDDDLDSIYCQYDIHGNRIKKPINVAKKISYIDDFEFGKNTVNPVLMKKPTTPSKKNKKSNSGQRKRDCIIS